VIWRLVVFIINEIYYLFNMKRLDMVFKKKSPDSMKMIDILYYMVRILSIPFLIEGLFSAVSPVFLSLLVIWTFKIVLYHISERAYSFSTMRFPIFTILNILTYLTALYILIR
jgi:hypothetical protein